MWDKVFVESQFALLYSPANLGCHYLPGSDDVYGKQNDRGGAEIFTG